MSYEQASATSRLDECAPLVASARTAAPVTTGLWRTSSPMSYRSNSVASEVGLARFDLRIIRATQSSARPRHDG